MKHYDTWARRVKTREDVPATFEDFFNSVTANETEFPYTIFAPPDRWGRRKTVPKLICLLNDGIAICEKHSKEFKTVCIPFKGISFLETGTMLLYSWIKIAGATSGGPITTCIEFNSVVEEIFRPFVQKVRFGFSGLEQTDNRKESLKREQVKFDIYAKNHYKFMNYAKRSILPGENVLDQILQPDVSVQFLKYFKRLAVTSHLTILTDRELIIIRDAEAIRYKNQVRYGGAWCFIPLAKICDVSLSERMVEENSKRRPEDGLLTFNVALTDKNSFNSRFEPLQKEELKRFTQRLKNKEYGFEKECS